MKKSWSESRRKASRLLGQETAQDTQAQATFEAVQSWVSPRLGTVNMTKSTPLDYEGDTKEYTKRKLGILMDDSPDQDELMGDAEEDGGGFPTMAASSLTRTRGNYSTPRVLTRADTPVMSNSSKKSPKIMTTPPSNVKSPYVPLIWNTPAGAGTPMVPPHTATAVHHQTPLSRTFVHECRLYHDSLRRFRQEIERINEQGSPQTGPTDTREQDRIEQDFLQSLTEACYSRARSPPKDPLSVNPMDDEPRKEGNVWALLRKLRQLGVEALFYHATDPREEVRFFLTSQAQRTAATPQTLLESLVGPNAPLSIQRWHALVTWLESCHDGVLPAGIGRSRDSATTSMTLVDKCLLSSDRETEITRAALNLILAGRLEDATEMASKSGLDYLAAQWSGGYAAGKDGNKAVGNPRRALWQVLMWQKANQQINTSSASKEAVALAALLSNNVSVSLSSPLLRTWERSLYAVSKAVMGRLQDNLLHQHNELRRKDRPPFPGTEFKEHEKRHLANTSTMQDMREDAIFGIVDDQPFAETQGEDYASNAVKAFWKGKHEIQSYMVDRKSYCQENDELCLRFLAHLALYVDSVCAGADIGLISSSEWKDDLVLQYLNYLGSREELYPFMVLYASYLPQPVILSRLPELLVPIESQPARKELLGQMSRFLEPQIDRRIISKLSQLVLAEEDMSIDLNEIVDMDSPEVRKMRVLSWYSLREDLYMDGLEYANTLLRHFLLHHKVSDASDFMQEMRPREIVDFFETASTGASGSDTIIEGSEDEGLLAICREHAALFAYLSARQAVEEWEDIIQQSQAVPDIPGEEMDESKWNAMEASIAAHEKRRKLAETKRGIGQNLVFAANKAIEQLDSVLRFDGGFLLDEEETGDRRRELDELRSRIIPDVVKQFQDVCMRTAQWMSDSLHDCVKRLGKDPSSVIEDLDMSGDPKSSVFAPSFWSLRAVGIMDTIAAETYDCLPVYTADERREILSVMAENMVKHLKYNSEFA